MSASFARVPVEALEIGGRHEEAIAGSRESFSTRRRQGFSTSICGLFEDQHDRSSCCALICCGIFLFDRNNFVVNGSQPPRYRFLVHVVGLAVAVAVGFGLGVWLESPWPLLGSVVLFVVLVGMRGMTIRKGIRREIQARIGYEPEPAFEGGCCSPHGICGCASMDNVFLPLDSDEAEQRRRSEDCCTKLWNNLAGACCGCCGCWCQLCGMCAVGQEHRELRRLYPNEAKFLVDYVTLQPYHEYYQAIEDLRSTENRSFAAHLRNLSKLSNRLLQALAWYFALILIASALRYGLAHIHIGKIIVVVLTFCQAFLVLYLVHWRKHRFDLSLDAVIKLFASGFIFATIAAMLVEVVVQLLGVILFAILFVEEQANSSVKPPKDPSEMNKWLAQNYLGTILLFLAFNSYITAGLVEELTKYFCYWVVEHPDFVKNSRRHAMEDSTEEGQQQPNSTIFQPRTEPGVHSRAAAITVAMVSTAVGFACNENLMYVQEFSQGSLSAGTFKLIEFLSSRTLPQRL